MAKVRVLEKSFINNAVVEEGAVIDYDGELGPNLELVEVSGKGRKSKDTPAEAGDDAAN